MKKSRTKQVNIRLTEAEHDFFSALSEETGQSVSALIRAAAEIGLGVPSVEEANIRQFGEIIRQLSRYGNNLNQLTKRANQKQITMSSEQGRVLEEARLSVQTLYDALLDYQRLARSRDFRTRIEDIAI